jgi:hypothetical protein
MTSKTQKNDPRAPTSVGGPRPAPPARLDQGPNGSEAAGQFGGSYSDPRPSGVSECPQSLDGSWLTLEPSLGLRDSRERYGVKAKNTESKSNEMFEPAHPATAH